MLEGGENVQKGMEAEKRNDDEKAIAEYEKSISLEFEGNHPYDRLAIIYRKRKQYDDEIRVLQKGINVFSALAETSFRSDLKPKLKKFRDRLEKVSALKGKND